MVATIESSTIDAIRNASLAFSQQSAPPGSSCALQARFLNKITTNFVAKRRAESRENPRLTPVATDGDPVQAPEPDWFIFEGAETIFQGASLDLQFANDETWANMFASAGFNTQEGVFLT